MKKIFIFILFLLNSSVHAEDFTYPQDVKSEIKLQDEEIKSLVWNRFINKNFVILSIDEKQGLWLSKNIESINNWCLTRWGFPKLEFSKECRIFCVPNKSLLKKLFGLDESRVEVRKKDGVIDITAMWLVLDENNVASSVAPYLTRASFAELEEQQEIVLPWWFLRSAEILNSSNKEIKNTLGQIVNFSDNSTNCSLIFDTKFEDYQNLSKEEKDLFDQQCLTLCLLFRKELGQVKLHGLLRLEEKNKVEDVLNFVYGYKSMKEFENKFLLYYKDLSKEVSLGKVPDSYLEIIGR